jgi:hypothetical protein
MRMRMADGTAVLAAACLVLSACGGSPESVGSDDCVSHYEHIATAPTWVALKTELLAYDGRGPVAGVRTQARGPGLDADINRYGSDRHVVRVIDLLKPNGHRAVQADVWRRDGGSLGAGVWLQCID